MSVGKEFEFWDLLDNSGMSLGVRPPLSLDAGHSGLKRCTASAAQFRVSLACNFTSCVASQCAPPIADNRKISKGAK